MVFSLKTPIFHSIYTLTIKTHPCLGKNAATVWQLTEKLHDSLERKAKKIKFNPPFEKFTRQSNCLSN